MSANLISNPVVGEHKWLQSAADTVERPPCYKWRSSLTQHNQKTTIFLPFLSRCILSSVLPSLPSPSTNFFKLLKSCCFRVLYCEQLTLETALSVLLGFEAHRNNQKKIFLCLLPFFRTCHVSSLFNSFSWTKLLKLLKPCCFQSFVSRAVALDTALQQRCAGFEIRRVFSFFLFFLFVVTVSIVIT